MTTISSIPQTLARAQLETDARDTVNTVALLIEQLRVLGQVAGCAPASWYWSSSHYPTNDQLILTGAIHIRRPAKAYLAVQQWAAVLGLSATPRNTRGTVQYEGEIGGLQVRIWAVLDNGEFYRETGSRPFYQEFAGQLALTGLLGLGLAGGITYAIRSGALANAVRLLRRH